MVHVGKLASWEVSMINADTVVEVCKRKFAQETKEEKAGEEEEDGQEK